MGMITNASSVLIFGCWPTLAVIYDDPAFFFTYQRADGRKKIPLRGGVGQGFTKQGLETAGLPGIEPKNAASPKNKQAPRATCQPHKHKYLQKKDRSVILVYLLPNVLIKFSIFLLILTFLSRSIQGKDKK